VEAAGADSRHWVPSGRSNGEKDQITARFYWWSLEEYRFAVAMVKDGDRVDYNDFQYRVRKLFADGRRHNPKYLSKALPSGDAITIEDPHQIAI
jgi:hypothetical protein